MRLDQLHPQLIAILQEHPDRFWLAYTVWLRLTERFPDHAARLAAAYGGSDAVGQGGNVQFGPASYIARSLAADREHVETGYLNTAGLSVGGISASCERLGIYRLHGGS